jgi:hypothetical protein
VERGSHLGGGGGHGGDGGAGGDAVQLVKGVLAAVHLFTQPLQLARGVQEETQQDRVRKAHNVLAGGEVKGKVNQHLA